MSSSGPSSDVSDADHGVAFWATGAPLDWVQAVGAGATVTAAFLAWRAIVQSKESARRNAEMIARERRLDFELGLLKELADLIEPEAARQARIRLEAKVRLRLLPAGVLPGVRAYYDEDPPESAVAAEVRDLMQRPVVERDKIYELLRAEITLEVAAKLRERQPET